VADNKAKIGGIMRNDRLARISVLSIPDRPGVAAELLDSVGRRGLNVHFIVQCIDAKQRGHLVICVDRGDLASCREAVQRVLPALQAEDYECDSHAASIAIFGPDFRERPMVAATMFRTLASAGVNILAISTSISTVTCIIDAADISQAEKALQKTFQLP